MNLLVTGDTSSGQTTYLLKLAANEVFKGNTVRMYTGESFEYIRKLSFYKDIPLLGINLRCDVRNWNDINRNDFDEYNVVIIDGLQYLIDIDNHSDVMSKLEDIILSKFTDVYFSTVTSERHLITGGRFGGLMDRVYHLSSENSEIRVIKDNSNAVRVFSVLL